MQQNLMPWSCDSRDRVAESSLFLYSIPSGWGTVKRAHSDFSEYWLRTFLMTSVVGLKRRPVISSPIFPPPPPPTRQGDFFELHLLRIHCARGVSSTSRGESSVILSAPCLARGSSTCSVTLPIQLQMYSESTGLSSARGKNMDYFDATSKCCFWLRVYKPTLEQCRDYFCECLEIAGAKSIQLTAHWNVSLPCHTAHRFCEELFPNSELNKARIL